MGVVFHQNKVIRAVEFLLVSIFIVLSVWIIIKNVPITTLSVELHSFQQKDIFQVYYDIGRNLNEIDSEKSVLNKRDKIPQEINFDLPFYKTIKIFRLDPWTRKSAGVIKSISLKYLFLTLYTWDSRNIVKDFICNKSISSFADKDGQVYIESNQDDPNIAYAGMGKIYAGIPAAYKLLIKLSLIFFLFLACIGIRFFVHEIVINRAARNVINTSMTVLFIILVSLPAMNMGLHFFKELENVEQRELSHKPMFKNSDMTELYKKYEKYFNDYFGFRNHLLLCNSLFKYYLLNNSPVPYVIRGKDGWLFFYSEKRTPEYITIRDWMGLAANSQEDLEKIKNSLESQRNYLRGMGIQYAILIAPNKETIYPEFLPDIIKRVLPATRLDQIISYLKNTSDIHIIDIRKDLMEAKKKYPVYFKTDTHWNEYGALVAYSRLKQYIAQLFPFIGLFSYNEYTISSITGKTFRSDLSRLMLLPQYFIDHNVIVEHKNISKLQDKKKIKKVLFFHDSFGDSLSGYLKNDFEDIRDLHWGNGFNKSIIEKERPGIVILEIVERAENIALLKYFTYNQ